MTDVNNVENFAVMIAARTSEKPVGVAAILDYEKAPSHVPCWRRDPVIVQFAPTCGPGHDCECFDFVAMEHRGGRENLSDSRFDRAIRRNGYSAPSPKPSYQ
jgi:hypothetical protein